MTVKTPIIVDYRDDIILCTIMDETTSLSQFSMAENRDKQHVREARNLSEAKLKADPRRVTGEYKQRIVEDIGNK